jgi:hypothetical protein
MMKLSNPPIACCSLRSLREVAAALGTCVGE